jgi:hypothetical protein
MCIHKTREMLSHQSVYLASGRYVSIDVEQCTWECQHILCVFEDTKTGQVFRVIDLTKLFSYFPKS